VKRLIKIGLLIFAPLLVPVGLLAFWLVRPWATRGQIELVAASSAASQRFGSEICGTKVQSLYGPTSKSGEWSWPRAELDSWRPLLPREGSMTSHISGIGVDAMQRPITSHCAAKMSFSYRCAFEDNGRSIPFNCSMTGEPVIVREAHR
jgi:hypothetical protein